MFIRVSLIAILTFLSACQRQEKPPSRAELEVFAETESINLVKQKLKDPDSANFEDVKVSWKSGKPMTCGKVNSKNGFGGMVGYQRFVSNGGGLAFLEEEVSDGGFDLITSRYC